MGQKNFNAQIINIIKVKQKHSKFFSYAYNVYGLTGILMHMRNIWKI